MCELLFENLLDELNCDKSLRVLYRHEIFYIRFNFLNFENFKFSVSPTLYFFGGGRGVELPNEWFFFIMLYFLFFIIFNGFYMTCFRQNGRVQAFSHVEVGSPPSAHDPHPGYVRPISKPAHFMPHISQNSPSRLGHQAVQRFNYGRPTNVRVGEWNHTKVQAPASSFSSGGPLSPGSSSLGNGMPWGTS
jgi:hypothetical protein